MLEFVSTQYFGTCGNRQARNRNNTIDKMGTATEVSHLMQKEVLMMEDTRIVKAVGMKKQGSWLNREGAGKKKLSWNKFWVTLPRR